MIWANAQLASIGNERFSQHFQWKSFTNNKHFVTEFLEILQLPQKKNWEISWTISIEQLSLDMNMHISIQNVNLLLAEQCLFEARVIFYHKYACLTSEKSTNTTNFALNMFSSGVQNRVVSTLKDVNVAFQADRKRKKFPRALMMLLWIASNRYKMFMCKFSS